MNRISDASILGTLWEPFSITLLSLSQNELGAEEYFEKTDNKTTEFFKSLAFNKTLRRMYLDMNPMSEVFVQHLTQAMKFNTSLVRLGIMITLTVSPDFARRKVRYLLSLNSFGRGQLQCCNFPDPHLLPYLLGQEASKDPSVIYGLL